MSHPVGACPLYFGIGSAVLEHNKHQRRQSLKEKRRKERPTPAEPIRRYGRYHRLIVSSLHLWCHHTCARHLSQSDTWCTWGMKAPLLVLGIAETDEDPM